VHAAWYTLDARDASLSALLGGLVAALRSCVPELPHDLGAAMTAGLGPEADDMSRAAAVAALVADTIEDSAPGEVVLVLDDLHELDPASAGVRLVELLARQGPRGLHLVMSSREGVPFGVERLRGRGELLELDSADLAFGVDEVGALLTTLLDEPSDDLGRRLHDLTGG